MRLIRSVTYELNDGIGKKAQCSESGKQVVYGDKYGDLPTPTRIGHNFAGWTDSQGKSINSETIVDAQTNHTLYANWNLVNTQTYTIERDEIHGWANSHNINGYFAYLSQLDMEYIKSLNMSATINFSFHITEEIDCYQVFAIASDQWYQSATGKLIGQATFDDSFYIDENIETDNKKPRERDYSGSVSNIAASRFPDNKFYFCFAERGALENKWIVSNFKITITFK